MTRIQVLASKTSLYIFYGLLAYVPVHIFISTWLGTTFGVLEVAKILKDIVLVIGFAAALFVAVRKDWFWPLLRTPIVGLIVAYAVFTLSLALIRPTQQDAELLGIVYNLRFFVFFLYAVLLVRLFDVVYLVRRSLQIVLSVGAFVALFGLFQYAVLPDTALTHVGYSRENGVLPAFHIDDKPDLERVMSTVRDPNSLGSYLIITGTLFGAALLATRWRSVKPMLAVGLGLTSLCLLLTFSRSAWLGAAVAAVVFAGLYFVRRYDMRQLLAAHQQVVSALLVGLVLLTTVAIAAKDSYFMQNVIFHADSTTTLEDPNELRLRFWQESLDAAVEQPFGYGPGTAGLASIRNTEQGTVLNENYYLQILHEVGVIGLLLFLAILAVTAYLLLKAYYQADNLLALALFAAFAGLLLTNFLVHIWANEAVAYTFWGLVGLSALSTTRKHFAPDGAQQTG